MATDTPPAGWKNRIVGHGTAPAVSFLANPDNWRIHPIEQQRGLEGVLDKVGWIQTVIVNKRSDPAWGRDQGVETMVDGHMRVSSALAKGEQTEVPFVYVDLNPVEEALVLATLDPIAAMAGTDKEKLNELIGMIDRDHDAVNDLLTGIAATYHLPDAIEGRDAHGDHDNGDGYREQYGVIVICGSESEQQAIYEQLSADGYDCKVVVT